MTHWLSSRLSKPKRRLSKFKWKTVSGIFSFSFTQVNQLLAETSDLSKIEASSSNILKQQIESQQHQIHSLQSELSVKSIGWESSHPQTLIQHHQQEVERLNYSVDVAKEGLLLEKQQFQNYKAKTHLLLQQTAPHHNTDSEGEPINHLSQQKKLWALAAISSSRIKTVNFRCPWPLPSKIVTASDLNSSYGLVV